MHAGVMWVSQREASLRRILQFLVVGFTLTTVPLYSMAPALSEVIRLTILVVVYMLQEVFWTLLEPAPWLKTLQQEMEEESTPGMAVQLMFLDGATTRGNSAEYTGGGISAFQSSFKLAGHNTFESNKAAEGGGFYAFDCTVNFPGENVFITNSASNHGGGFTVVHSTLHLNGSTTFKNNSAASGGGMYISASNADIDGRNCFISNTADSGGGAIYARYSAVELNGKDLIVANATGSQCAENHASSNTSILQGSSSFVNNSANYGGGIYSESSNLTVVHNTTVVISTTQHCEVGHNILMLIQISACIKQHMSTSKTIMQLSLVVQYMLKMYLPEMNASFTFRITNHLTSIQPH